MTPDADFSPIEEAAAEWLVRRDRGLSAAQEAEMARWLAADPRHAATFEALRETWTLVAAVPVAAVRPPRAASVWRWTVPTVLAAAAAVALLFFSGPPDRHPGRNGERWTTAATTAPGLVRKLDLPDGSVVHLNGDSRVEVAFDPAFRRVRLVRGEAHFSVSKDAARPFVVSAADVAVRVVGTVFNVRLGRESVDVLVTEGKVRVGGATGGAGAGVAAPRAEPGDEAELTAGERVSIARAGQAATASAAPVPVTRVEMQQALAWQTRRLEFDAWSLGEIVAQFNRYNDHKLVVADARLLEQRFGGSIPAGDRETFVRMLEANFGVVAERRERETLLRRKAP